MSKQDEATRLANIFQDRFGDNWRHDLKLVLRADVLYWLINLAERAVAAEVATYKATPPEKRDMGVLASIGNWKADIENVVTILAEAPIQPPKKKGK